LFFEQVIRENLDLGRPEQVQLIFNRRILRNTRARFRTRVVTQRIPPPGRLDSAICRSRERCRNPSTPWASVLRGRRRRISRSCHIDRRFRSRPRRSSRMRWLPRSTRRFPAQEAARAPSAIPYFLAEIPAASGPKADRDRQGEGKRPFLCSRRVARGGRRAGAQSGRNCGSRRPSLRPAGPSPIRT